VVCEHEQPSCNYFRTTYGTNQSCLVSRTRLLKPTLFDVIGLRKGDCGIHVEVKRRRGAPRVFLDYGGLSRDEFYRRRYRAKKAATKHQSQKNLTDKLIGKGRHFC